MSANYIPLNIDFVNEEDEPIEANYNVILPRNIIDHASDYSVSIRKAEIPIQDIPFDIIKKPYNICIYADSSFSHPVLSPGYHYFSFGGEYRSVEELLNKVNNILDTYNSGTNPLTFGLYGYNMITNRITYKIGVQTDIDASSNGAFVYIDHRLKYLLDGFTNLYQDESRLPDGKKYNRIRTESYSSVSILSQERYLLNRLYNFKTIRIYSGLKTYSYYLLNQNTNSMIGSQLLGEIVLNSLNYSADQTNSLLVPQVLIKYSLVTDEPIKEFNIYAEVHYANGNNHRIMMRPEAYLSLTLGFEKNIIE